MSGGRETTLLVCDKQQRARRCTASRRTDHGDSKYDVMIPQSESLAQCAVPGDRGLHVVLYLYTEDTPCVWY